ncbi:MAG TPA: hypothetical protein VJ246_01910 [Patescibacteria group bacterium]|nr:hypothetical protein [Patescibacteria group bacterium]
MATPFEAKVEEVRRFLIEKIGRAPADIRAFETITLLYTLDGVLSWESLMITQNEADRRALEFEAKTLRDALILFGLEQADQSVAQQ